MLTIQAEPPRVPMPTMKDENREYNSLLAIIQTMLDNIDFGRENWAYLVQDDDGCDRLLYKNMPFSLSCTIWAPCIPESDIEITKVGSQLNDKLYLLILHSGAVWSSGKVRALAWLLRLIDVFIVVFCKGGGMARMLICVRHTCKARLLRRLRSGRRKDTGSCRA